eukprot:GILK01010200.1.p1 GENE.GILK01010200.1~~GILK01010200.1.p1  ORF type:complete len:225 (+),score=21.33 GILK01010200.1:235-909(+)
MAEGLAVRESATGTREKAWLANMKRVCGCLMFAIGLAVYAFCRDEWGASSGSDGHFPRLGLFQVWYRRQSNYNWTEVASYAHAVTSFCGTSDCYTNSYTLSRYPFCSTMLSIRPIIYFRAAAGLCAMCMFAIVFVVMLLSFRKDKVTAIKKYGQLCSFFMIYACLVAGAFLVTHFWLPASEKMVPGVSFTLFTSAVVWLSVLALLMSYLSFFHSAVPSVKFNTA